MFDLLAPIVHLIVQFRYEFLFPLAIIEGPIVTVIAGLLVAHGYLSFIVSYVIVVIADLVADVGYYYVGALSESTISQRVKVRLHITSERIAKFQQTFHQHAFQALIAGKILHGPGVAVLVAAGAAHMSIGRFLGYNLMITLVKSFVLLMVGFYFGQALGLFQKYFDLWTLIATGVVIVIAVAFSIHKLREKKHL